MKIVEHLEFTKLEKHLHKLGYVTVAISRKNYVFIRIHPRYTTWQCFAKNGTFIFHLPPNLKQKKAFKSYREAVQFVKSNFSLFRNRAFNTNLWKNQNDLFFGKPCSSLKFQQT